MAKANANGQMMERRNDGWHKKIIELENALPKNAKFKYFDEKKIIENYSFKKPKKYKEAIA
jgi:hypothetical protein